MRQTIVLLVFTGFLAIILSSYSTGPAANGAGNLTGATGAAGGCYCHNSTSSIGTTVELDSAGVLVTTYHPGVSYTVKIKATNNTGSTLSHFGFQVSTIKSANAGTNSAAQAGTWGSLPANTHNTATGSCSVIEHSTPLAATTGSGGAGSTYVESIPWTAPASGTGSVIIYGALNAVNYDGTDGGDNFQLATPVTITEVVAPVASVSISLTTGSNPTCAGSGVIFTATPTNGGAAPSYQWKIGSTPVGANSDTFSTNSLTNGQVVTCVMTSNLSGVSGSPATSNGITLTIDAAVTPSISIIASDQTICAGAMDTFTATPVNGGTPSYQWKVGTTNVGTNSPKYITSTLTNGQSVSCVMTSTASCASPVTATSSPITVTVNPTVTPSVSISTPSLTVCSGVPDTFTAIPTNGGTPSYQWKVGTTNVGTNSPAYVTSTLTNGQIVSCVMTSTAVCASPSSVTSNSVTMTIHPSVRPSLNISTPTTSICPGTAVAFAARDSNGGSVPIYQWKIGTSNVGTDSSGFTTAALTNGQTVTCFLTSNATCASPDTATSNGLTISVSGNQVPAITISQRSVAPVCSGSPDTLTAQPTNGGANPSYQWRVNGVNTGSNSSSFISSALSTGAMVECILTSSLSCAVPDSATSNPLTISITPLVTPTLTISGRLDTICAGALDSFSASGTHLGSAPTYEWLVNGFHAGTNSAAYTTSALTNNNIVRCLVTSNAACAAPTQDTSNAISITVHPSPSVSITPSGPVTVCAGDSLRLTASGGSSYSWTNSDTGTSIWVHQSATYDVTGSTAGCSSIAGAAAVVSVDSPAIPTITQSSNVLTSSGASGYQWILNGTSLPGDTARTYTITQSADYAVYITDTNGCHAISASSLYTYVNGIVSEVSDLHVKLFPVPNHGSFVVEAEGLSDADLSIYDIYGHKLYQQKLISGPNQITGIDLVPSVYYVTVSDVGRTETVKMEVIKEW